MGWQWHQLDHMQIICTSLQTDNYASTSPLSFYIHSFMLPAALNKSTNPRSLMVLYRIQQQILQLSCLYAQVHARGIRLIHLHRRIIKLPITLGEV